MRSERRHAHRHLLLVGEMILEQNLVFNDRSLVRDLAANLLPSHLDRPAQGEPDIANDTAIVPPVVPCMLTAALRQTWNRGRSNPIIDFDGNLVGPLQLASDVKGISGVYAL